MPTRSQPAWRAVSKMPNLNSGQIVADIGLEHESNGSIITVEALTIVE
jgi:hypothetical protein